MATLKRKIMLLFVLIAGFSMIIAGCSSQDDTTDTPTNTTPNSNDAAEEIKYSGGNATVIIADHNAGIKGNDDWIQNFFVGPVQKEYPEIEIEFSKETVKTLLTAGSAPDIVLVSNPRLHDMKEMDLPSDLTGLITKYNIDLEKFDPSVINEIRKLSGEDGFLGLPFSMNYGATIYNKDIFDRFGIDYPKDGMDWNEYYDLSRQLTRTDEGVNYIGMIVPFISEFLRQYTLPVVNPDTMKAELTTEAHKDVFSILHKLYTAPGHIQNGVFDHHINTFFGDQRVAMYPGWIAAINTNLKANDQYSLFNWDITTFPVIPNTTIGKQVDFHMAIVNGASKNREAAFQVLRSITSEDIQSGFSKAGRISPLTNPAIRGLFGSDSNVFEGKNVESLFTVQAAAMPSQTKFDTPIENMLRQEIMKEILVNNVDLNTAIQLAEERANKEIVIEE